MATWLGHQQEGMRVMRAAYSALALVHIAADQVFKAEARIVGVEMEAGVRFRGRPSIQRIAGRIVLRRGVVLNSRDFGYHARNSGTKLLTDLPGALIEIGSNSRINGATIHAQREIRIGASCYLASGVVVLDADGHVLDPEQRARGRRDDPVPVSIGNRVWLGLNVIVLKGVSIGDDTVVGAGSVVSRSLPAGTLCVGQPARVVRELNAARKGEDA